MDGKDFLAEQFEASRPHLNAVAYRMLGSRAEAEDAVQEAWLRLARMDASEVQNLRGWLTTVVARLCLDQLRARKSRREEPIGPAAEAVADDGGQEKNLADAIGPAMLVVLETLAPAERVAFVLHDMFNLPFEDIAPIVNRSTAATRQLASRARRRVQGAPAPEAGRDRQRELVAAFLAASRGGDFGALLAVLDPQVLLRSDAAAVALSRQQTGAGAFPLAPEIRGADSVATLFKGRAQAARPAWVDGEAGLVFAPGGKPLVVFSFVTTGDRISEISLIADPNDIAAITLDVS